MVTFVALTDAQWGIIGTTTVALTTIIVQLISSAQARKEQRALLAAERNQERASRRRDELKTTYSELLRYLHRQLRPVLEAKHLSDVPMSLNDDEAVDLRAKVGETASLAVRDNLNRFVDVRLRIDGLVSDAAEGFAAGDAYATFEGLRSELKASVDTVEDNVRSELEEVSQWTRPT